MPILRAKRCRLGRIRPTIARLDEPLAVVRRAPGDCLNAAVLALTSWARPTGKHAAIERASLDGRFRHGYIHGAGNRSRI